MSYIISFILPLIYIVLYTESLGLLFRKKFQRNLPFTFIISAIILFISLFVFKTIYVGLIINILICLVFPIYLIKSKMTFKDIKDKYLTKGLISFIVVYIFIYLYDLNRSFTRWDELSHWGKMVKEIIRLDDFYSIPSAHLLVHKDYPPIFSLMETFYTLISGGYKEANLIRCIHLFEGSLVISSLNYLKKNSVRKTIVNTLLTLVLVYLGTLLFDSEVFLNSIYIDYPLAMLVGYTMSIIFKEQQFNHFFYIRLMFLFIFLLLTKQVSIALYLVCLLMLLIRLIANRKFNIKKILYIIALTVMIPFTFYFSWNAYKNNLNLVAQFEISDIHVSEISGILSKTDGETWQQETSENYMNAILSKNISSSYLNFTYFGVLIVLILALFIIYNYIKDKVSKSQYYSFIISLIVGYLGYILLMYLSYVFNFGSVEGPTLASFERYMSTYILIGLYSIIFILVYYLNVNWKYLIVLCIIPIALINPKQYLRLRPDLILFSNHKHDEVRLAAEYIDRHTNVDDKVFIVDQKEKNGAVYYINYYSDKVQTNRFNYEVINIKDNMRILKGYDYLYTYSLINDELSEHQLYKIEIVDNKAKLTLVK